MMHHPLMHYNGVGYGDSNENTELATLEADAADLAADLEMVAIEVSEGISEAVEQSRQYEEHRKLLYMVGAPLVVYVGLTNSKHKGLGLLSALVGAYVGIKNYQDEKDTGSALGGYGAYGAKHRKKCVRKKPGRKCPPGYRLRNRADGRVACCR